MSRLPVVCSYYHDDFFIYYYLLLHKLIGEMNDNAGLKDASLYDSEIMNDYGISTPTVKPIQIGQATFENSSHLLMGGMGDNNYQSQVCDMDSPSGFINSGNTCFLAAATQILVTIPSISRLVQERCSNIVEIHDH